MRVVNLLFLLIILAYIVQAQNSDICKPWSDRQRINCTLRFFPSNNSDSRAIKAFQEIPIIYNSKICSSNHLKLSKGRKGAEVIEGNVSCAGTTNLRIQAEFTEKIAIRYFQIRCVAKFPLNLNSSVVLPFLSTIESWRGRTVFDTAGEVWTAQVTGQPFHRGDWSTDGDHEWSLSATYTAYSNANENVNVSIDLSLRSNLSRRQINLPRYPDFAFLCSLRVFHEMEDNKTLTWKRVEGLSIKFGDQNCESDPVDPAEGVDVQFLRKGGVYGRVSCIGPARIKMLASYPEETRVEVFQLSCAAGFPIDVHVDKALSFRRRIRFGKIKIQHNFRYTATTDGNPEFTEAWNANDEFHTSSLSSEYTFYSIMDPTVNITISVDFQSTANKSTVHSASVSQLQIYSDGNVTFLCSTTNPNDPPLYFASASGDNPSESRELFKCLQFDKVGDCTGKYRRYKTGTSNIAGHQELNLREGHGLAYCRSKKKQTWLEYFTPITTYKISDNISLMWMDENVIHLRPRYHGEILLVPLPNRSPIVAEFYETQIIWLQCYFVPYILQQPLFWWIAYANGTKKFYWDIVEDKTVRKEARDFSVLESVYVRSFISKHRAEFGMNAIGCGATYWNNARNATAIFPVKIKSLSEVSAPGFFKAESEHLVSLGRPLHLNCLIDFGEQYPYYRWTFYGKNGLNHCLYDSPLSYKRFYEVSQEIRDGKKESNLTIQAIAEYMEGDYFCTAFNARGNSSHRFKVILDAESNTAKILICTGVGAVIAACIGAIVVAVTRKCYIQRGQLSQVEIKLFESGDRNKLNQEKFAHENAQFMPYDGQYDIDWKDFQISYHEKLGEGAYGVVFKGHMVSNAGRAVAIKTLKEGAGKNVLLALLSELKVMIYLGGHENVVKLIGACTSFLKDGRVYLLVEFCPTGSVETYLRKIDKNTFRADQTHPDYSNCDATPEWDYDNLGTLSIQDMIGWGVQIARGMQHLESKKVIHGDLAARNILLYSKSQVKITDFGLSRQLLNYDNYVKKSEARLPWRWLALETLKSLTFTHKSDVWGYGVTLWEIFTLGMVPYPGMAWTTEFVSLLEQNLRLHRPQYASENLYKIMYRCWDPEPGSRPDFQELEGLLLTLHV